MTTQANELVSVSSTEADLGALVMEPSISGDGDRVAFAALTYTTPPKVELLVRDRSAGVTASTSIGSVNTSVISGDGRHVGGGGTVHMLASRLFPDVPTAHPFFRDISWMVDGGITTGNAGGTFRPGTAVTRQELAAFGRRLRFDERFVPPSSPTFTDVPRSHPLYVEVEWAAARGYVRGYPDGSFRPNTSVTREAAAAVLYRLAGSPSFTPPTIPSFLDVPTHHPFRKEIEWATSQHIAGGYDDERFRPGSAVNRESAAAFLHRFDLATTG
jgi:hypothetical protein